MKSIRHFPLLARATVVNPITLTRAFVAAAGVVLLQGSVAAQAPGQPPVSQSAQALSLADAIRIATGSSEQLDLARAGRVRARGQYYQARSQLLPQLGTTLNYQKTLQNQFASLSKSTPGGADSSITSNPIARIFASPYTLTFGLTAQQALFTGGRATANMRAARAGQEASEIGVASGQAQVMLEVTQAYYDALLADQLVTIAESSLVQTERTLRQVQLTQIVGAASEFEMVRARVTRDNQRPQWLQSRTNRDIAYLRLRQLLDFPADKPMVLTDTPAEGEGAAPAQTPPTLTTVEVSPSEVLTIDPIVTARTNAAVAATDTLSSSRAPVRQALKSVEIAKQQLRATRAARFPTIGISTNYQRLAYPADGFPRSLNDFFPNWTAGINVSFPFFTGGRVRGEELAAEATVDEAQARLKLAEEGATLDVRVAIAQLEQAEAAWQASVGTEQQATRAYSIAEVRYREGISTQLELSDIRVQLQQALANRARAARDRAVAYVRVQLLPFLPLSTGGAAFGAGTAGASGSAAGSASGNASGNAAGAGSSFSGAAQSGSSFIPPTSFQ